MTGAVAHDLAVLSYSTGVPPAAWLGLTAAEFERLFGGAVYEAALTIHEEASKQK